MSLVNCSACGRNVSAAAAACPGCGQPNHAARVGGAWVRKAAAIGLFLVASVLTLTMIRNMLGLRPAAASIGLEFTMNGLGQGECRFTNAGGTTAASCGRVEVRSRGSAGRVLRSTVFCSGDVPPHTTVAIGFFVSDAAELCGMAPRDNCTLSFVETGP